MIHFYTFIDSYHAVGPILNNHPIFKIFLLLPYGFFQKSNWKEVKAYTVLKNQMNVYLLF